MLGNSDEGTRKMWTYKAKYSGWGKLQPSPLWRVKVTRRKRSILDVAFLEFKDFTNKYLWKACVTLALVEMHQLGLLFTHQNIIGRQRPWFASQVTNTSIREQSPVEIFVGISEVSAFLDWSLDRVWPLEALKREQASRVTLPTLLLLTPLTARQLTPGDAPITPDTQCDHHRCQAERGGGSSKHLWYAETHPWYVIFIC